MSITMRVLLVSLGGSIATTVMLLGVLQYRRAALDSQLREELDAFGKTECASIVEGVHTLVSVHDSVLQKKLRADLNVAQSVLDQTGAVSFDDKLVTWNAVDQYSKKATEVDLPKMMVGNTWLGQNTSPNKVSPVVDEVKRQVGGTCTIFQRMNQRGDMLRVSTNVEKLDGTRAVGTYIPARNADGSSNPVLAAVLKGETYFGSAFVVNAWYITAYKPIFDASENIVGVLYVGVKQENVKDLREGILNKVVGKSGYVFVLGANGSQKGRYIISKDGARDGENIYDARDANGDLFIREMIAQATGNAEDEVAFVRYQWQNQGETKPRAKIAALKYYEPWGWVIGAGAYEDDFHDARGRLQSAVSQFMVWGVVAALLVTLCVAGTSLFVSRRMTRPLVAAKDQLRDIAEGEGDLTKRLAVHTTDEVGELANWFNTFLDKLQGIIREIADNANTLSGSAAALTETAASLAAGAEETTQRSSTVASASEEMSANMSNMSAATEEMTANVKSVASATEEMSASIAEIAKNAEQASLVAGNASELAEGSNANIGELGGAADEIGKVIEVIQDIAEQTNLLALNATIEAARAGDAGKGFAVVATEVKELAKQTADATEDIRRRIEAIQGSTNKAVDSIGKISEVIRQVNEISATIASAVEQQHITTREIAEHVSQTSSAADTVSTGVTESASAGREISQTIVGVDGAAKQAAQAAQQTKVAGSELSRLAADLNRLVGQFKV